MLVRDDVAANGKLWIAPVGMITSMQSISPEDFREYFKWYVSPENRTVPVQETTTTELVPGSLTQESVEASIAPPKPRGRPKGSRNKTRRRRTMTKPAPAT